MECVLFEVVSRVLRDARPHPEERVCRRRSANSKARTRVSKDEDGRLGSPSCFETHRSALGLWKLLRSSCCDAPQHEGDGARRIFGETNPSVISPSGRPREGHPATAKARVRASATRYASRGPRCGDPWSPPVVMGPGSRCARPGRRSLGQGEAPTCGCGKRTPAALHCFRIVIYNECRNSNVSGRRRAAAAAVAGRALRARDTVTACALDRSRGRP
jgi:hypothetical protein